MAPAPPTSHALTRAISHLRSRIFSTSPPKPTGQSSLRTGAKYLRRRLVGPSMLSYYPPSINFRSLANPRFAPDLVDPLNGWDPLAFLKEKEKGGATGRNATPSVMRPTKMIKVEEVQRLKDVERKKMLGKGPPKKGQGKRAALKGGKKK